MCGIAGFAFPSSRRIDGNLVESLSRAIEHRGPDDFGVLALEDRQVYLDRKVPRDFHAGALLLHRRLSILDLSPGGWQPMGTPDGRYYIVYNGEIYNYVELRAELEALGVQFRTASDTEVLLAAYVQWGPGALNRLVGMFALAILDTRLRKIFLARDFFGIKPLYYVRWQGGLVFASELVPLLQLPGIRRRINTQRLYDYLRHGITDHGGETLLEEIRQVPAAHYMDVPLNAECAGAEPIRYWSVDLSERTELSFDAAARRLQELFVDNVRIHLRSDVPLGTALSGGIDSSSIVAVMRQLDSDLTIHAFSYVADEPVVNEERWVDIVASKNNVVVHKVSPSPSDLIADFEALVDAQGECFGSTSIYAQRRVFQQARAAGIKVMLDGQGADELLGGYPYYVAARFASFVRDGKWVEAVRFLRNASTSHAASVASFSLRALDFLVPSQLQDPLRRWINKELMPAWMHERWFRERGVKPWSPGYISGNDVLKRTLHQTLTETSLPALLRYEDRNSMAFSIESRVPFLTPALVKFVFSLPEDYLIARDGTTKAVLRQAMRKIVPDEILDRKDKIGFATPERAWLLAQRRWVEQILASDAARGIPAIDAAEMSREWSRIVAGRRRFDFRVWRWLNTILWINKFSVDLN